MGGEYLPDCQPTEVEIARVELESTTADVISIRARRLSSDKLIHYRVVDEYNTTFEIAPKSSKEPLTHDELIELIESAYGVEGTYSNDCYLPLGYNQTNYECGCDAESLRHFTTISSSFYSGIYDHYEAVFEQEGVRYQYGFVVDDISPIQRPVPKPLRVANAVDGPAPDVEDLGEHGARLLHGEALLGRLSGNERERAFAAVELDSVIRERHV